MIAVITLREDLSTYLRRSQDDRLTRGVFYDSATSRRAAKFYVNAGYLNTSEGSTREAQWEILG